jgi:hypothetical protein
LGYDAIILECIMPPSNDKNNDGWIRSDQLILPRQTLSQKDIEPFLQFLFKEIARKPKRLKLKQTAGVARYLKAVAAEAQGSAQRDKVDRVAEVLWLTMLDSGQIKIAPKEEAIQFVKTHALRYLASFDVNRIVEFLQNQPEPLRHTDFFRPPKLSGARRTALGREPARLQDDLTERIYAAYHAVRRTGTRNARGRIATVLNELGHEPDVRSVTDCRWGPSEVNERVRQFEDRIVRRHRLSKRDGAQKERLRNMLVDSWIHGFHFAVTAETERNRVAARIKPIRWSIVHH